MKYWGARLLATISCTCLCISCKSARSSREAEGPTAPVTRTQTQHASSSAEASDSAPTRAPSSPETPSVTLAMDQPSDLNVAGPGSALLIVHVQVPAQESWDPFSVRVKGAQEMTLGAFVVPYGQAEATFPLRLTDPQLVNLKASDSAKLRVVAKSVQPGGVFPHSAQLWMTFRAEP